MEDSNFCEDKDEGLSPFDSRVKEVGWDTCRVIKIYFIGHLNHSG